MLNRIEVECLEATVIADNDRATFDGVIGCPRRISPLEQWRAHDRSAIDDAARSYISRRELRFKMFGVKLSKELIPPLHTFRVEALQLLLNGGRYVDSFDAAAILMAAASGNPFGLDPPEVFVHFRLLASEQASGGTYVILHSSEDDVVAYLYHDHSGTVTEYARIDDTGVFATFLETSKKRLTWLPQGFWTMFSEHASIKRLNDMFLCAANSSNRAFTSHVQQLFPIRSQQARL
jgi:hypothetical protein